MACGTPVITFARGSAPEIIKDGKTGFLVNPSDDDIRGNWLTRKAGFAGLCEAVEKIYSMEDEEYERLRELARMHAATHFSAENMAKKYLAVYEAIVAGCRRES